MKKNDKKNKSRNNMTILIVLIAVVLLSISLTMIFFKYVIILNNNNLKKSLTNSDVVKEDKSVLYNNCLKKEFSVEEITEEISIIQNELNSMLKKYNVFVYYEDLNSGFTYKYNENKKVYGASLIKIVDALYLYDNGIDLDNTMVYKSKYITTYRKKMISRKIGEEITLRDLMDYALSVSDNSAHLMLLDYIGYNNLKNYGNSLGATSIFSGSSNEKYGYQTASDTNIYLKRAYEIITNKEKYPEGNLLREYMSNDYRNCLILDNEKDIAHKYGYYSNYFHDVGIVFDENPYTISILTIHGNGNYKNIINNIHKKINEMHIIFRNNRENNCYTEIYYVDL